MILRHFDNTFTEEKIRSLPPYDGFVYQIEHGHGPIAEELAREGKLPCRYFNILTHPEDEWHGAWVDLVRAIVPPIMVPDPLGSTGLKTATAWGIYARTLWDWPILDQGKLSALEAEIMNECILGSPPGTRGFLDLAFLRPRDWMFVPTSDYGTLPGSRWTYQERRMRRFIRDLGMRGLGTWSNGDRRPDIGALYLEYANLNWDADTMIWHAHADSVLSVDAEDTQAVYALVDLHARYPTKWIAFSGWSDAATEVAYELAAA
jgi:hypothetical protein